MTRLTAVLDACVLYPAPLRSFFMYLAVTDVFRAKWTDTIHAEWMRSVRNDYPDISQKQVERIRELMNSHVRDCLITGYEPLISELNLPDPNDRHVLAAAIHAGAEIIVTANLADFPSELLQQYGVRAEHPDEFIHRLFQLAPHLVCEAARNQRKSLKNPALTVEAYLTSLERQGIPRTVASLRGAAALI